MITKYDKQIKMSKSNITHVTKNKPFNNLQYGTNQSGVEVKIEYNMNKYKNKRRK